MKLPLVGEPVDRVDGKLKVTGRARFTAETPVPGLAYAVLVQSTIGRGRIVKIDDEAARSAQGVVGVMTHENAPRVRPHKAAPFDTHFLILQDDRVHHDRQAIAVVVADTFERATHAASLVRVTYEAQDPVTSIEDAEKFAPQQVMGEPPDHTRGDPDAALEQAALRIRNVYSSPVEHHNAMEPHATVALWEGDRLTVHDSTQYVYGVRRRLAAVFGMPLKKIRVICPFVGGGFGSKGPVWPHVPLAAMVARLYDRPVKLVLARSQMYGSNGYRPRTIQTIALGADKDGKLQSVIHDTVAQTCDFDEWTEASGLVTRMLYAVPNLRVTHRLARLNAAKPTFMRAPGEATGTYALESAMDELACAANVDPVLLRLRNYADVDPDTELPFSSKALRECYELGAEKFGWSERRPQPRSMRDGRFLIGMGMATATYPMNRNSASAHARIGADGIVLVQSATGELGTGSYTVFSQIAADTLGVPIDRIRFELGDTDLPEAPISAGSMSVASVGPAVYRACSRLREKLLKLVAADKESPLYGARPADVEFRDGGVFSRNGGSFSRDGVRAEASYGEILRRAGLECVEADGTSEPGKESERYAMHAFGAQFARVRVDPDLGEIRVTKFVGAFAAGRILNAKTARSQLIGGITFGIGMALLERTSTDRRTGRIMSANLADYLLPVHADVGDIEAYLVPEEDRHVNPIGAKGVGEIGITGVAAAIANAVYHATGHRFRDLPITVDKMLSANP